MMRDPPSLLSSLGFMDSMDEDAVMMMMMMKMIVMVMIMTTIFLSAPRQLMTSVSFFYTSLWSLQFVFSL